MGEKTNVEEIEPLEANEIPEEVRAFFEGLQDEGAPGSGLADVLKYLPLALAFIQGVLSGAAEIPAFRTRVMGQMKEIGPCPIKNV